MAKKLQLENQQFGYWYVIEKDLQLTQEKKNSYWICQCKLCGKISSVRGTALVSGKSTKCDECNRHKVLTNEVGNTYGKLLVEEFSRSKNNRKMWRCKCSCGNYIEVSTTDLRDGSVQSCGKCPERQSLGELAISKMLINYKIPFIQEYIFEDFVYENGRHPRFDFYVPTKNYIIEYDGKQHFTYQASELSWNTKERFEKTQKQDRIKNQYCFDNNIPIIRIPYTVDLSTIGKEDLEPETSKYLVRKDNDHV